LASEQELAPVPSFFYLGTTPIMLGTSSKSLKVKIEPYLAIHCGCPKGGFYLFFLGFFFSLLVFYELRIQYGLIKNLNIQVIKIVKKYNERNE
jgi:hypothetical protein